MILWIIGSSANEGRLLIRVRASGLEVLCKADSGMWGIMAEMIVRIVWSGKSGSQDSSQATVGVKPLGAVGKAADILL